MKRILLNLVNNGQTYSQVNQEIRQIQLVNLFFIIGLLSNALFTYFNYTHGFIAMAYSQIGIILLITLSILYFRKTQNYTISSNLVLGMMFLIHLGLTLEGGINTTGLYWVHIFPAAAYFLKGEKVGTQ